MAATPLPAASPGFPFPAAPEGYLHHFFLLESGRKVAIYAPPDVTADDIRQAASVAVAGIEAASAAETDDEG